MDAVLLNGYSFYFICNPPNSDTRTTEAKCLMPSYYLIYLKAVLDFGKWKELQLLGQMYS